MTSFSSGFVQWRHSAGDQWFCPVVHRMLLLAQSGLRRCVPAIGLRAVAGSFPGLPCREVLVHELVELPPDCPQVARRCAADDDPSRVFCCGPRRPSRDQDVQQVGMVIEHDGDTRGVIMSQRQRADRLCPIA
jgi:hypothetical protein